MHIGQFLKIYREHYKLSQRSFAELIGFDDSGKKRLEKWEQGKGGPKEIDSDLIKRYFDISLLTELNENYLNTLFTELVPRGTLAKKPEVRPLYTIEELKKKIEEQWQVIKSQQETIHMIAKNAPPGINDASKNG